MGASDACNEKVIGSDHGSRRFELIPDFRIVSGGEIVKWQ
jgi:hypothetical protein